MAEIREDGAQYDNGFDELWAEESAAAGDDLHLYEAMASGMVTPSSFSHWAAYGRAYSVRSQGFQSEPPTESSADCSTEDGQSLPALRESDGEQRDMMCLVATSDDEEPRATRHRIHSRASSSSVQSLA